MNVVAVRYQEGAKLFSADILSGRSRCPYCGKILSWYELIPLVSYILQFGRCRTCKHLLSIQYPLVELWGGLVFMFVPQYLNPPAFWILVILTLTLIALIDARLSVIPDALNLFLALLAAVLIIYKGAGLGIVVNHLLGGILGGSAIGSIILLSRGRGMGMGDLKLALALGLLTGWPKIVFLLMAAFVIGGFWSAILLILKKKSLKDSIPFGPFLSTAAILVIFVGDVILNWYK